MADITSIDSASYGFADGWINASATASHRNAAVSPTGDWDTGIGESFDVSNTGPANERWFTSEKSVFPFSPKASEENVGATGNPPDADSTSIPNATSGKAFEQAFKTAGAITEDTSADETPAPL